MHTGIPFPISKCSAQDIPATHLIFVNWADLGNMNFLSKRMLLEAWPGIGPAEVSARGFARPVLFEFGTGCQITVTNPVACLSVKSVPNEAHIGTGHEDEQEPAARRTAVLATMFLAILLAIGFSPAILGGRTLLHASWDAPSVMNSGAYDHSPRPVPRLQRTSDPGASAWQTEAWYKLISREFWEEFTIPLWNPYNAYGTPLLADAISQPFFSSHDIAIASRDAVD